MLHRNIIYTILASSVAGIGLLSNSIPAIIASMIISPLLVPTTSFLKNNKKKITTKNILNLVKYTAFLILIIYLVGLIIGILNNITKLFNNESERMYNLVYFDNKKKNIKLLSEFLIAICVGIGLPLSVKYNDILLLVAFNIAPTITPPLTNSGLYTANYLFNIKNTDFRNKMLKSLFLGMIHVITIICLSLYLKRK